MKSIFKLILLAVLSFYVLSANATDAWNDKIAYQLAVASNCAYKVNEGKKSIIDCFEESVNKAPDTLDVFRRLSSNEIEFFETTGEYVGNKLHAAILVKVPDGLVLAFRGTQGKLDWLNNLSFTSLNDLEKRTLHERGTYHGFDQPLKILINEIRQNSLWRSHESQMDKTLYITGHSKGGAMATGAAVDLNGIFRGKKVTYTFEAARFFTPKGQQGESKKSILDKIWRFEYQYDIVPHLPLGQVTRDYLIEKKRKHPDFFEFITLIFRLEPDWLETNNFNFVSSGKLAYVDGKGDWNDHTEKSKNEDYYRNRAWESIENTAKLRLHPVNYVIDQHSECYLEYLRIKTIGVDLKANLRDKKYCLE